MPKRDVLSFSFRTSEYCVASVHTNLEAHQLAWLMDSLFETRFWRNDEIFEFDTNTPPSEHTCFYFSDTETENYFWIFGNTGSSKTLVSSKPKADFVLVGKGETAEEQMQTWLEKFKYAAEVSLVYLLQSDAVTRLKWLVWLEEKQKNSDETQETDF
jgi:hypothetical protein